MPRLKKSISIAEIKEVVSKLSKKYGVQRAYLFGSYARGDNNNKSDIDIRIDRGDIQDLVEMGGLYSDLEDRLGKIDLVATESLDEKFLESIKEEEILLYER